jgi:glycine/D-amino acid oxidase-like deaminating enzyme
MPALRLEKPLWLSRSSAARPPRYRRINRDLSVDVAVVGGGITGVLAAWRLSTAGMRVALFEAERIGRGSTAASTALLMQEPDQDFRALRARYGTEATTRIWQLSRQATIEFVRTIRALRIPCGLAERDSVYFTVDPDRIELLRQEYQVRHQAGLAGRWLDAAGLQAITGISGGAGIRTAGNAQIDPYRACIGLCRAADRAGAMIFERSPVRRINADRNGAVLRMRAATVRADHVIVATGYATPEFKPLMARFRMLQTYVAATERLSYRTRRDLGLGPVMLWDTRRPYRYARWTADNRLILGGGDRPHVTGPRRVSAFRRGVSKVVENFEQLYPLLQARRIEYCWEGLFATTPDGLPYIGAHRRYPRHLFALGYGGNGMTFGFLASRFLLERLSGSVSPDHDLFGFSRKRLAQ